MPRRHRPTAKPAPPARRWFSLDDIPDTITALEAARLAHLTDDTIKKAIRTGKLPAYIPGREDQKPPIRSPGRGNSYRIRKADFERWLFGRPPEGETP